MDRNDRIAALQPLSAFLGEWHMDVDFPKGPLPAARGHTLFERTLDGQFLVQRSEIPLDEAPNSTSIVALDHDGGAFTQHYFDSRGVVRVYAMTLADGVWTLTRTAPDFWPLDFAQRFVGTFAAHGETIAGRWETAPVGTEDWELDFHLTYTRVA
jgi:hypothetical protein